MPHFLSHDIVFVATCFCINTERIHFLFSIVSFKVFWHAKFNLNQYFRMIQHFPSCNQRHCCRPGWNGTFSPPKDEKHCSGLPVDIIFLLHFFILSCVKPQIYYFQKRTIAIFWENDWNDVSNGSSWTVFCWYWWNFPWILQLFALFINTIPRKR